MKIIIADDEHLVRYSLRSMLEELDLGLSVVAEAANGEGLVGLIAKHQPELCFVDIRMPGLNGLTAIKRAREAGSHTKWIILTSHAEFEYASEAIRLGASAYLLKPAGPANLAEVLIPLIKELEEQFHERATKFERSLIVALGSPSLELAELPPLSAAWLTLLSLDAGVTAAHQDRGAFSAEVIRKLRNLIKPALGGSLVAATWLYAPGQALVTAAWDEQDTAAHQAAIALRESVSNLANLTADKALRMTGFTSDTIGSWSEFRFVLTALRDCQPHRIILGTGNTHHLSGLLRRLATLSPSLRELGGLAEEFILARDRGDTPGLEPLAIRIRDCFAQNGNAIACLESACRFIGFRTGQEVPPLDTGAATLSSSALMAWANLLVSATRAELPELRRAADANVRVVERVEHYLRQHLKQEIRVPDIAGDLGLSPNYLSSVYHRLTQCTISERLSGLRLEMARELLARPGSQVKEVAAEVGYKSTRHFAQLYRERYGQYPSGR